MDTIMEEKFDLFCTIPFSLAEARFDRLCKVDPVIHLIGNQHEVSIDGFLGVSLSIQEGMWLAKVLKRLNIHTYPIAMRYKSAGVSRETAKNTAQQFIHHEQQDMPELAFADVADVPLPWWLIKMAYGFIVKSEQIKQTEIAPAGKTICVDRASGLILQERELLDAELILMLIE